MKIRYSASVMDSVHGVVEVPDNADEETIIDIINEDIENFDLMDLDWDVTDTEEIK